MLERTGAFAILASVAVSAALLGAAMRLYPGGTWCDPAAEGHAFWANFLCDLEWKVALNGRPNPVGSTVAGAGMASLALGVGVFFQVVPALFGPGGASRRAVRLLGGASTVGTAAVVLMPSERFGDLHGVVVIVTAAPGLAGAVLAVAALARGEPRPRVCAALGGASVCAAVVDLGLYARHFVDRTDCAPLVPALQKVAVLLLLGWLTAVSARVLRLNGT